jgi:hypothetical protein
MREPLFPGEDYLKVIKLKVEGLGKFEQIDLELIRFEDVKRF